MRTNVNKVILRDEKLSELDQRAENLQYGASQFETQATRLKRKYWWQNCKVAYCFAVYLFSFAAKVNALTLIQ